MLTQDEYYINAFINKDSYDRHMTIVDLSRQTHTSSVMISRYFNLKSAVSIDFLFRYGKSLGMSQDQTLHYVANGIMAENRPALDAFMKQDIARRKAVNNRW